MFAFITIGFKILVSLLMTLCLMYIFRLKNDGVVEGPNLLVFTLFFSSFLSFIKSLSIFNSEISIGLGILASAILFVLYVYFNIGNIQNYFVIYSMCLFISLGYFFTCFVVLGFYALLANYSDYILEYMKNETIENNDENSTFDSE